LVHASDATEYRDCPDNDQVTSTVVRYLCPCGKPFTCSFAAQDREGKPGHPDDTVWY
jgi:hypothetical protein